MTAIRPLAIACMLFALSAACSEPEAESQFDSLHIESSDFPDRTSAAYGELEVVSSWPHSARMVVLGAPWNAPGGVSAVQMHLGVEAMEALVGGEPVVPEEGAVVQMEGLERPVEELELELDALRGVAVLTLTLGDAVGDGALPDGRTADDLADAGTLRLEGELELKCANVEPPDMAVFDPSWSSAFCADALTTFSLGVLRDFFAGV